MAQRELKYPIDFKKEVCLYAKKENIKDAAAVYGVHSNTVSRWLKKYRLKGIKGFIVKRKDTQLTKLDNKTLEKIVRYKKKNPKSTLEQIKEKYKLDCHLSLISRKLRKVTAAKSKSPMESVIFKLKVIKHTLVSGDPRTVYRFSIHSCGGKLLSIGFTDSYYSENICFFIRYSFERLKALKKFSGVKTIFASVKCIKPRDYVNIVRSGFKTELKFLSKKDNLSCAEGDIDHTGSDIEPSIEESFEKILKNYIGSDFQNVLLASVVDVRKLAGKMRNNSSWNELPMPSETKRSLYSLLRSIKSKGDKAVMEFDFDSAKKEYDKAYSVISSLEIGDKMLLNTVLLDKAKLFYSIENYHAALMLFRDCMKVSKKNGAEKELADSYYYIGLIHKHFQNIKGAVKYFTLSAA
ncbi:MAG: helix-turn-helix domain-containing protein [Candidatus Delongbacteria bacterium]|nr:helix-turn-helix domain-containing protein [Candidatus Delongbacteria bacterium]